MTQKKYPIPPGFTWNFRMDTYVHEDGRTWDSDTNIMSDKDGNPLKTSADLPIDPPGSPKTRVAPADVEAAIKEERYEVFGVLTLCILTMQNGFQVTGESACADPANFDAELGRRLAREKAKEKIWPLLGYALRQSLHEGAQK